MSDKSGQHYRCLLKDLTKIEHARKILENHRPSIDAPPPEPDFTDRPFFRTHEVFKPHIAEALKDANWTWTEHIVGQSVVYDYSQPRTKPSLFALDILGHLLVIIGSFMLFCVVTSYALFVSYDIRLLR